MNIGAESIRRRLVPRWALVVWALVSLARAVVALAG